MSRPPPRTIGPVAADPLPHLEALDLFDALCDLPADQQRAALGRVAAPTIRRLVEQMLVADQRSLDLLHGPLVLPDDLRPEDLAGRVQLGAFRLTRPLGAGGMGEVWRAEHGPTGRAVAIKLVQATALSHPAYRLAFMEEVRAAARLRHPAVVPVLDHGSATAEEAEVACAHGLLLLEGAPWLAMELAEGGTVAPWVRRGLPWLRIGALLLDLLDALAHAHAREVIHLDLKPGNILLDHHGRPLLSDFGLAAPARGLVEGVYGTPAYMPPEQQAGAWRDYGPWTDLYALGVVAAELVFGPLDGGRPAQGEPAPRCEIPREALGWIGWLTSAEAERRPRSARAARDALLRLCPELVPSIAPVAPQLPAAGPGGAGLVGLRPPRVHGRAREQATLWAALEEVEAGGGPRRVRVSGPAGVGASALARWLCEQAVEQDRAQVFRVRCAPLDEGRELAELLERALRTRGLPDEGARARAVARLGEAPGERAFEAMRPRPQPVYLRAPEARRAAVWQVLDALRGGRPAIVWLEDVHWSAEAVALAAQAPPGFLVLLTAQAEALGERPDVAHLLAALDGAALAPGPLDPDAARELARDLVQLAPDEVDRLLAHTGGEPLFTTRLVEHWIRCGDLVETAAGVRLRPGVEVDALPDLAALWQRRLVELERAAPEALALLELAAVHDLAVDPELLARAHGSDALEASLAALLAHDLVADGPTGPVLAHQSLRAVVLDRVRRSGRGPRLHAAWARALEGQPLLRERAAHHHAQAGDHAAADAAILGAIVWRNRRMETARVDLLLDTWEARLAARGEPPRSTAWGELLIQRAARRLVAQDAAGAEALLRTVAAWGDEPDRAAIAGAAEVMIAQTLLSRGRWADTEAVARQALTRPLEPTARARGLFLLGEAVRVLGRPDEAALTCREGLALARDDRDPALRLRLLEQLAACLAAAGDLGAAEAYLLEAGTARSEAGDWTGRAGWLYRYALLLRQKGDDEGCLAALEEAVVLSRRLDASFLCAARINLLDARLDLGRLEGAREALDELLREPVANPRYRSAIQALAVRVAALERDWARLDAALDGMGDLAALVAEPLAAAAALIDGAGQPARAARLRALLPPARG